MDTALSWELAPKKIKNRALVPHFQADENVMGIEEVIKFMTLATMF